MYTMAESKRQSGLVKQDEVTGSEQQRYTIEQRSHHQQIVLVQSTQEHSGLAKQ